MKESLLIYNEPFSCFYIITAKWADSKDYKNSLKIDETARIYFLKNSF